MKNGKKILALKVAKRRVIQSTPKKIVHVTFGRVVELLALSVALAGVALAYWQTSLVAASLEAPYKSNTHNRQLDYCIRFDIALGRFRPYNVAIYGQYDDFNLFVSDIVAGSSLRVQEVNQSYVASIEFLKEELEKVLAVAPHNLVNELLHSSEVLSFLILRVKDLENFRGNKIELDEALEHVKLSEGNARYYLRPLNKFCESIIFGDGGSVQAKSGEPKSIEREERHFEIPDDAPQICVPPYCEGDFGR